MELEYKVKEKLILLGFTPDELLLNRRLIWTVVNEVSTMLLGDYTIMNEVRDSLHEREFDLVNLPRTKMKEEHYNIMQGSEWHKDYFDRRMYYTFIDSRPLEELEKYMTIKVNQYGDKINDEVTASANWKNKK
jgi:hypothetical protein